MSLEALSTGVESTAPVEPIVGGQESPATAAESTSAQGEPTPEKSEAAKPDGTEKPAGQDGDPKDDVSRKERQKLNRLYKERAEWKAKAELLERKALEMQRPTEQQPVEAEPKFEDFNDLDAYKTAVAEHARRALLRQASSEHQRQQNEVFQQKLSENWAQSFVRGEQKYDDFFEKVGEIKPVGPAAIGIMRSSNGEDVAYYLASNISEARKLAQLDAVDQLIEIGKLSEKLLSRPQEKTLTKAPAPIKPVETSATISNKKLSELSQQEFEKRRREMIAGRR